MRVRWLRQLLFGCLLSLVTAQVLAGYHAASYGFSEHQHAEHNCVVQHYAKADQALDTPDFVFCLPPAGFAVYAAATFVAHERSSSRLFNPRAPPLFS